MTYCTYKNVFYEPVIVESPQTDTQVEQVDHNGVNSSNVTWRLQENDFIRLRLRRLSFENTTFSECCVVKNFATAIAGDGSEPRPNMMRPLIRKGKYVSSTIQIERIRLNPVSRSFERLF